MSGSPAWLMAAMVASPLGGVGSERSSGRWLGHVTRGGARIQTWELDCVMYVMDISV